MARAVELGYSGIAFNRTIKGAMSQSDGCTIARFPLSSLLKLHVSLSSGASFHRRLLGVPENTAFRQYTRLTVVVDSDAQSSALNSGNPVLKTYDLVAVRPLNQTLFDHACNSAQVDMISIDFGKKLPFRLKLSSVKAAIERGVYFEIMYSSFLEDAQVRRQMISNAKLLVEWTRGKNLIVSSAAPSFHELRGPNDVCNLLYLLGLSNERAKAAISKNCRLLISNALRKKQFYREAIKVEMIPAGAPTNPKEPWIVDYLDWDPLSCGEGDLLLEDLAKSFAESGKVSQTVKSIDFTSLNDTGFRIADKFHSSGNVVDFVSSSKDLEEPIETWNRQQESTHLSTSFLSLKGNADEISEQAMCFSISNPPKVGESRVSPASTLEELNIPDTLEATLSPIRLEETTHHNCVAIQAEDMVVGEDIRDTVFGDGSSNVECESTSRDKVGSENIGQNGMQAYAGQLGSGAFNKTETGASLEVQLCVLSNSPLSSDSYLGNHLLQLKPDLVAEAASTECADKMADVDVFVVKKNADDLASGDIQLLNELANEPERDDIPADEMMNVDSSIDRNNSNGLVLGDLPCVEEVTKEHGQNEDHHSQVKADSGVSQLSTTIMIGDSFYQGKDDVNCLIEKSMVTEVLMTDTGKQVQEFVKAEPQCLGERKSGNLKVKRSASGPVVRFPFKRFLQLPYKRKGRTSMYMTKKR